jgi:lysophospholipase L1-like esterase
MNINPSAKTILCYGDSNTWGADPKTGLRYPADRRWTGVAQAILGDSYYLIEEGLCGRTTMYTDPEKPRKNGKEFLDVILHTHKPLDLIIIMLGTNDLKTRYNVNDSEIGKGIEELVWIAQNFLEPDDEQRFPKVFIIAPPLVKEIAEQDDPRLIDASRKSKLFASKYSEIARDYNCAFLDASEIIEFSDIDGYHLDESAHKKLGQAVAKHIKNILG